jgi:cation diffusion facilitator family transporter
MTHRAPTHADPSLAPEPHRHDHDHDGRHRGHDHHEASTAWSRARHWLSDRVGGHSHAAIDSLDAEIEANRDGRRALFISLGVLGATFVLQALVVAVSGSVALLGDTLHNLTDALTAIPLLVAFRLGTRPPTRRYTYGYGRAEDIAGLFVVAMIALSAAFAGYEAIDRLIHPRPLEHLWLVAAAGVIGFLGNELVAMYRIRVGRRIGSAALVADGLHARTDGFTSLAVVIGAGGVALGWQSADAVIGLLITVAILGVLRSAVREVAARLMDAVDADLVDDAKAAVADVDHVVNVHDLRIRWIGHTLRAEVDLTVTSDLTLLEAHEVAHHAEAHLLARVPRLTAATVHTSPQGVH